jgi:hypothetical protein
MAVFAQANDACADSMSRSSRIAVMIRGLLLAIVSLF